MGEDDLRFVSLVDSSTPRSPILAIANTLDELAPDDVEVVVLDGLTRLPYFGARARVRNDPSNVKAFIKTIAEVDAVVIVGPECHGLRPGPLANVLGWLGASPLRPLIGKPTFIVAASMDSLDGIDEGDRLHAALQTLGAMMLSGHPLRLPDIVSKVDLDSACLRDGEARQLLASQLAALAALARDHRRQSSSSG